MAHVADASRRALAVVACIALAAMAHFALNAGVSGSVWAGVLGLPVVAAMIFVAVSARKPAPWFLVPLISLVVIYAFDRWAGLGFAAAYGLPHAAAYLLLLWYFGRSLREGREPLITRVARKVRGTLSPEIDRYTRRLTVAWCVFFGAQVAVSVVLLALAPLQTWSFFVNVLNAPLVVTMFLADFVYRSVRFRNQQVTSIPRIWRAFIEDAAGSFGSHPR